MDSPPSSWSNVVRSMPVTDTEYLAALSREAVPTIQWIKTHGVRFIPTMLPQITLAPMPMITPSGGGAAMLDALGVAARRGGAQFFYETTGRGLIEKRSEEHTSELQSLMRTS